MRVYRDDQKFLSFRVNAFLWGIVVLFTFLLGAFWFVQGVQAEKYRNLCISSGRHRDDRELRLVADLSEKKCHKSSPEYLPVHTTSLGQS